MGRERQRGRQEQGWRAWEREGWRRAELQWVQRQDARWRSKGGKGVSWRLRQRKQRRRRLATANNAMRRLPARGIGPGTGRQGPLQRGVGEASRRRAPRETTSGHRSSSKAKDLPQAVCQKRRPGCSRTPWHRGCPVKAAQRRRWHDTRNDDDTKTTAVRDGPHGYRPHSLHYHLSSPTSD